MYQFSQTSKERLETCHIDLQIVMNEAIKVSQVDFGIACGQRPVEEQQNLYAQGRTKPGSIVTQIDGVNQLSKHNYTPSEAVDIYAWVNNSASWDQKYMIYLGGLITGIASRLYQEGKICHKIRWGGNWDSDGVILDDQRFDDQPHFEIAA